MVERQLEYWREQQPNVACALCHIERLEGSVGMMNDEVSLREAEEFNRSLALLEMTVGGFWSRTVF